MKLTEATGLYHIALDGEDEPTLWLRRPRSPFGDEALTRRCDVDLDAWALIVLAVEAIEEAEKAEATS